MSGLKNIYENLWLETEKEVDRLRISALEREQAALTVIGNLKRPNTDVQAIIKWWDEEAAPKLRATPIDLDPPRPMTDPTTEEAIRKECERLSQLQTHNRIVQEREFHRRAFLSAGYQETEPGRWVLP